MIDWIVRRARRYLRLYHVRRARSIYSPKTWAVIRENRRSSASLRRTLREEGYLD